MMRFLSFLALLLFPLTGCTQKLGWAAVDRMIARDFPDTPSISTDSLAALIGSSTAPVPILLDVREAEEYAVSHLPGALHLAPETEILPPALETLPRDTPLVAYCSVGYRSARLTQRLREAGFTDIRNLEGSIFQWANEGRPVERDGEPVREVHPYDAAWGTLLDREYRAPLPED